MSVCLATDFHNSSAIFFEDVRNREIFHNDFRRNREKAGVCGELEIFMKFHNNFTP